MLRTNLSSRPFYNERLASFVIAVVGVVAIAVAVVCVQQILSLSAARTQLRDQIARDESVTARADMESVALQNAINAKTLKGLALNTQQANALIDERTFSWTVLFSLLEKTLPNDVRIVSVTPQIDKNGVLVVMSLVSKRSEDLATFIEGLQATGAFYDVLPRQADSTEDGMRRASLEARYLPPPTTPPAKPSEKPAAKTEAPAKPPATAKPSVPVKKGGGL